ncbi:MAG: sigma-54 dependent transcriptional regulator [Myxococcota bacterium]
MSPPTEPAPAVDTKRLATQLTSPLRVALLELLLEHGETPVHESALARDTAALIEDVRACLEPLAKDGWVARAELDDALAWRVVPEPSVILRPEVARAAEALAPVLARLRLTQRDAFRHLVGDGPRMQLVYEQARIAARTSVPVLLTGETGTGKELIAWAIHRLGERASRPFESINAGAIPTTLFESELFGHERGAFTGAKRRRTGHLVQADGGTFFLDEIGELPLGSQAKLLRVLQEKVVLPVGGTRELATDFRLISATNRDLGRMAADGLFREDLRYRVNVFEIRLPSLRERPEDVPALARHFLELANWRYGVPRASGVERDALQLLAEQRWPGNVRELENTVYRAALLAGGQTVTAAMVKRALEAPGDLSKPRDRSTGRRVEALTRRTRRLDEAVRDAVVAALEQHGWNLSATARQLDISRVTLYRKIEEFGLSAPQASAPAATPTTTGAPTSSPESGGGGAS